MNRIRAWVTIGALVGMISSLMVFQYGQARIWFAMSRDGLLPKAFAKVHTVLPDAVREHVDRGLVRRHSGRHLGHRNLRRSVEHRHAVRVHRCLGGSAGAPEDPAGAAPQLPRALVPLLPILSIVFCLVLMLALPLETWLRFFVWLAIGLVIYATFGKRHSVMEMGEQAVSENG